MALTDDINNLPTTPAGGASGHLNNHAIIHSALKNHESDKWKRPRLDPAEYGTLEDIPDGVHPIIFWADAYGWGLPHSGPGSLTQWSYGSRRIQRWVNREGGILYRESMRILSDGVWSPWVTEEFGVEDSEWVGRPGEAGKRVRLDADGKFFIATSSITGNGDPVNLAFLRSAISTAQDEVRWDRGRLSASQHVDDAPDGWVSVWGTSDAVTVGLPIVASSMVLSKRFGQAGFQLQVVVGDDSLPMMIRRRSVGVWGEWQDFGGAGDQPVPEVSLAGFKRVPLAVTLGNPNGDTRPVTGSYRVPVQWNAPIIRWRLHVSAKNPRTAAVGGHDVALARVTWGKHAGSGDFTATPTTMAEGVTVPGTGESVALPWQTTPIQEGIEHLIGFDYASTSPVLALAGGSWSTTGNAATATATTTRDWLTPLDWWVEAETYATTPVIAFVGDSTSVGVGTSFQVKDGWPSRYCRDFGALPIHYAASGASTFDFRHNTDPLLQRWQDLDRPDAIVWALGANDFGAGTWTVEQVKARAAVSIGLAGSLAPAVYVATAKPRNTDGPEQEANMAEFNEWLRSLPHGVRDCFDVASKVDDGSGNILPEFDADGVHVNDLGVTAMLSAIRQMTAPPILYNI